MELWQVAAAILSAALHAGWNAAVKASPRPEYAMTAQMIATAAIVLPGLLWTGLPAPASWPWIAASTALNVAYFMAILRAYALFGFGTAYPVIRALSVLLVVPLAAGLSGEKLSPTGLVGVGLIAASLLFLAVDNRGRVAFSRAAVAWTVIAGVTSAAYIMCDAQGVRQAGSPWAYGFTMCVTMGIAYWLRNPLGKPWRVVGMYAVAALPNAVAAVMSYVLILWVWGGAPIAPAAALRDTSSVFAILIAIVWLKEPFTPLRLCGVLLSAAAVPLLRFA
jgi:drug/metabolite transporter (DMT)-like permease